MPLFFVFAVEAVSSFCNFNYSGHLDRAVQFLQYFFFCFCSFLYFLIILLFIFKKYNFFLLLFFPFCYRRRFYFFLLLFVVLSPCKSSLFYPLLIKIRYFCPCFQAFSFLLAKVFLSFFFTTFVKIKSQLNLKFCDTLNVISIRKKRIVAVWIWDVFSLYEQSRIIKAFYNNFFLL